MEDYHEHRFDEISTDMHRTRPILTHSKQDVNEVFWILLLLLPLEVVSNHHLVERIQLHKNSLQLRRPPGDLIDDRTDRAEMVLETEAPEHSL